MQVVLYVIARTGQLLLGLIELAMFLRAILSWFIMDDDNRFMAFLFIVTEPFVLPIRLLLSRIKAIDESPLDISFFVAFLVITVLNSVLPVLTL